MRTYKVKMPFEAGQVYGKLTLIKCVVEGTQKDTQWMCECVCTRKERRHPEALRASVSSGRTPACAKCTKRRGATNPTRNMFPRKTDGWVRS